jgi:hypothetical protein
VRETKNGTDYRGIVIVVLLWIFMVVVAGTSTTSYEADQFVDPV